MDEFDFKLKARREIHDLPVKDLDLLHLIMRNIKENPTEPKYRRIKSRKVNDQIYSLMSMVGFVKKTYDFESHAILENHNGSSNNNENDTVAVMLQLVEESQNSRERKRKEQQAIKEQLRREKEKKKELQQQLKLDYLERKADKERLELIKGRISPNHSTTSLESPSKTTTTPPPQEKTDEDKKMMTIAYRLIGSLALLLLLAFAAVNASPFQLRKSPKEKGAGIFVELKKYSENLYGPLPYGLLEKFSECHQWVEQEKYQELQEQFKRSGLHFEFLDDVTVAERRQRIYEFKSELNQFMASQLLNGLNLAEVDYETFWLLPVVYFKKFSYEQVGLLNLEFVEKVYENNLVAKIYDPVELMNDGEPDDYFLKKINVEKVWESGNTGAGVKVGLIDTGARWTHDLLKKNYAGLKSAQASAAAVVEHDYAWFDPHEFRDDEFWCLEGLCAPAECCLEEPFDIISHGSHVLGLILQVAPDVEWVAAKGCRDGNCLRYGLLKSAEFMACPSDRNGTNPDCSLAPDLINNSWGNHADIREDFFEDIVKAWREMNIVPLFANGNSGPSCGTANSPGNFANVLGIGATDRNDRLAEFSSRGPGADSNETASEKLVFQQQNHGDGLLNGESKPSLFGWIKPDLCAPGSKLYSASGRSDDHYLTMSGTSMATPVVSGVVALMIAELKKQNKNVDYFDAVYNSLTQTAYRELPEPAGKGGKIFPPFPWRRDVCGLTNYTTYPNHFYGHGRVDAFKAIQLLQS